mgnify:CR=1 FL=1
MLFFAVDGKEKFVGKALHTLLKEHLIYINEVTKTVSQHEDAYQLREKGTLKAFWVLLSLMEQKKNRTTFLGRKGRVSNSYCICGECGNLRYSLYIGS